MTEEELLALERRATIFRIRLLLSHPLLALMCFPERESAMLLAAKHNITAVDLLMDGHRAAKAT